LPLVAELTAINIANPGNSTITVTIRQRGASGVDSSPLITRDIPALGIFQTQVSAIFPGANLTNSGGELGNSPLQGEYASPPTFCASPSTHLFSLL
jgi:hypothetical protein